MADNDSIFTLPDELLRTSAQVFHIPITEATAPQAEREPSQERDVDETHAFEGTPADPRGPSLVDQLAELPPVEREAARRLIWGDLNRAKREISEVQAVTSAADTNGNLDMPIYQVPGGYELVVTRVNIEASTPAGVAYTPAAPFSAATAWAAIYRGLRFGNGAILDFAPPSSGGTIFPGIWTDSATQAIRLRGGEWLSLHVVGSATFASNLVWVRMQGTITEL